MKVKFTDKDLKDFIKAYGTVYKSTVLITIKALTKSLSPSSYSKCPLSAKLKKKSALIRTHIISTRASTKILEDTFSMLNISLPVKDDESCLVKCADESVFLDHLIEIFHSPETVTEYFFVSREDSHIDFQDFLESVEKLGLADLYNNLFVIFENLSDKKEVLQKVEFFYKVFNNSCVSVDESWKIVLEFRNRMRQIFKTCVKAFEEISPNGKIVDLPVFEKMSKKVGMNLDKFAVFECFSKYFIDGKVGFKDFKRFWTGKDSVCKVKICEESVDEQCLYCQKHLQTMLKRGEEILNKLQIVMKQSQVGALVQDVLKEEKRIFCVNGFELQEKDVASLREFLKFSGYCKKRTAHSMKLRVKQQ